MANKSGGYIGNSPSDSSVTIARQAYTSSGITTDFTFTSGYTPGYLDAYLNGVRLIETDDYVATDGTILSLTTAAQNGDTLELIAYKAFNVSDFTLETGVGGNFDVSNNLTVGGNLDVDGHTELDDLNVSGVATVASAKISDLNSGRVVIAGTDGELEDSANLTFDGSNLSVGGNISVGGTLTYEDVTNVDSIGIVTAQSGIHIDDSIVHIGDTDTKIRFPAADTITAETGGSERVRITSAGLVGIGTDNPSAKLEVSGDARVTGILTVGTASLTLDGATGNISGASLHDTQVSAISKEITDSAVDVFVYDTSKDSDGGAWRKRTQNTSWYIETLGTATRGTRREFPAVAVIVCGTDGSNGYVHIYDGDDPDLPMWMVFSGGSTAFLYTTPTSVAAMNGMIFVGIPTYGLPRYDFIGDTIGRYRAGAYQGYKSPTSIENRDVAVAGTINAPPFDTAALVNDNINDVAMTVLPNAPIDDTTGLPTPTIAVATAGGVSVIKDDGNVYDLNIVNRPYSSVDFTSDNLIFAVENPSGVDYDLMRYFEIPSADRDNSNAPNTYGPSSLPALFPTNTKGNIFDSFAYGSPVGLSIIDHADGTASATNGMIAYVASEYNTGYMHGDIKGAFLSDTDTTNVTGTELWPEGDFADSSEWSSAGAQWTFDPGGTVTVNYTGGGYSFLGSSTGTLTNGKKYVLSFTITGYGAGGRLEASQANSSNIPIGFSANGSYSQLITYTGTTGSGLGMYAYGGGTVNFTLDNLYLRELEEDDRSVNNNGLAVYGTVTKSAVATGADLVAYSGFSASNLFVQPYNSDLNPGTGDYSFTLWFKCSSTGGEQIYIRRFGVPTVTGGTMMRLVSSSSVLQWYVRDTSSTATAVNSTRALDDGLWHCAVGTREGATAKLYIDGKLDATSGCSANSHDPGTTSSLVIGAEEITASPGTYQNPADLSSMALIRYSLSAPSAEQIKKIYEDEKCLFHENAKATLYGSSDAVTALAFDEATNLLHVGTSSGRSDFSGLRRINNTTTAVTTAISAHDGSIAQQ